MLGDGGCVGVVGFQRQYNACVQRQRQFDVFACQEQFVRIRSNAFDNEIICVQCCNFTDKRVKPVVALALSQQGFCSGVNGLENLRIQCRCKCFCRCIGAQAGRYRCDQDFCHFVSSHSVIVEGCCCGAAGAAFYHFGITYTRSY